MSTATTTEGAVTMTRIDSLIAQHSQTLVLAAILGHADTVAREERILARLRSQR